MKPAVAILLGLIPAALYAAAVCFIGFRYTGIIGIFLMLLAWRFIWKKTQTPQAAPKNESTAPDLSVYVMRDQQTFGPFTHAECVQMIENGQLQPTDWAYLEGDDECEPLGELLAGIVACD